MKPEHATAIWWALAAATVLAGAIYFDIRKDVRRMVSARNVVLVGYFMWYLLEAIQGSPTVFQWGAAAYEWGIFLVVLSAVSFLVGYHRFDGRWFDGLRTRVGYMRDWNLLSQTLVIGILIGAIPIVLYGLADPAETLAGLVAARHGWRGTLVRGAIGDFRAAVVMIENCVLGVAWVAIVLLEHKRRTRTLTIVATAVLVWFLVRAYGTGSRSVILIAFTVPGAWYFWRSTADRQRKLVLASLPCALLFYWFASALAEGRKEGRLEFFREPQYVGHEMFRELLYIVDQVPRHRPYRYGETMFVELINPIPRFLWESKPLGFGIEYAAWHGEDALAGGPTLSPGIIGEMYLNFGILGIVLLSAAGGAVCRAWDRLGPQFTRSLPVLMVYSVGLGGLLMQGRSFTIQLFYPLIASLICLWIATARLRRLGLDPGQRTWRYQYST